MDDKERIKQVLSRVRSAGGLTAPEKQIEGLTVWFRTLVKKGYTKVPFLSDREEAGKAFVAAYPNPMTRQQYMRAFIRYLSGLHDDEYETEFPGLDRAHLVTLLQGVTSAASKERTWPKRVS